MAKGFFTRVGTGIAVALAVLVTIWAVSLLMSHIEGRVLPVVGDFTIEQQRIDGNDVLLVGTMRKWRECGYAPPPRARADDGAVLFVESASSTASQTWPADAVPRRFGPWRIRGGARRAVELYLEHRCHPLYPVFTYLGRVSSEDKP